MPYKYKPKDKEELIGVIKKEIFKVQGTKDNPNWKADLNCIDTSLITDMSSLFSDEYHLTKFNGDISNWNVSNVKDMSWMFYNSEFNGNISDWDVSNVKIMRGMFFGSKFEGNISDWNVSNVENMFEMFGRSNFNEDISNWNISNVQNMAYMFYQSKFNQDISKWDVTNVKDMNGMFQDSNFNGDIGSWPLKKQTDLENISISPEYSKLPDKIIYPETIANIFIYFTNNNKLYYNYGILNYLFDKFNKKLNKNNFKKIFEEFLKNRKEMYKSKSYKPEIINKLILNDIADILKYLKEKDIQQKFMQITMNKNGKEPKIDIS